jgi:hypothetical protein
MSALRPTFFHMKDATNYKKSCTSERTKASRKFASCVANQQTKRKAGVLFAETKFILAS